MAPCQIGDALLTGTVMVLPWYGKTKWRCQCNDVIVVLTHYGGVSTGNGFVCMHSADVELLTDTGCDAAQC